ncbi:hypothetical protein VNO78_23494 [Psophocarpus tetragonolobus]|uniref:Phytocyanin domain-containing protein n=1 Tax=Psophocarpus tetragonolobus TaxID=3891 RepID=A0AAN9S441_PSOTE
MEILVLLVLLAMTFPHSNDGAEHVVNWIIPPQGHYFYTSLTVTTTCKLNDTLVSVRISFLTLHSYSIENPSSNFVVSFLSVFNFTIGFHNVVTLSKINFKSCNMSDRMALFKKAPVKISLNCSDEFYFICSFMSHYSLAKSST